MTKLACFGIDLSGLPHLCRAHGLDERALPPAGAWAVGRRAPGRFAEVFDRPGASGTFFTAGEDLEDGPTAMAVAEAARLGHEIGSHGHTFDHGLSRRPTRVVGEEIRRGAEAIRKLLGRDPVGFRAPGFVIAPSVIEELESQGFAYDSSVLPSLPYWAARTGVRAIAQALGRRPASTQDVPGVLLAPRGPYRPDPRAPHRRGRGRLVELPVTAAPLTGFPLLGSAIATMPRVALGGLYRGVRRRRFLNVALEGVDLLDDTDGASLELARRRPDLRVPASTKRQRIAELLGWIAQDFEIVTLEEAARRLAPRLGSRSA